MAKFSVQIVKRATREQINAYWNLVLYRDNMTPGEIAANEKNRQG